MKNILITGGVGFIGTNSAKYFAEQGHDITIVDNFSRIGVEKNESYLRDTFPKMKFVKANVQDTDSYIDFIKQADVIIHLAGQTAVTTSINNPRLDFISNLQGSFELLEAVRKHNPDAVVLYSSTNKVYGNLEHHKLHKDDDKKQYLNLDFPNGVGEDERLDFISPYGCSKGAADVYMQDYARMYGLKTVVFRQSCIYGPFQMGVEDQGWVAHFANKVLKGETISIFGDGYQVRDLLYVEDLVKAYDLAIENIEKVKGDVFNIGGGINNAFSLINVMGFLEDITGNKVNHDFADERSGDQKYFVSNNSKLEDTLGWSPRMNFENGIKHLVDWLKK